MKTQNLNSIGIIELSYEEMSGIYGGGWLKDLYDIIDKNYTEFKKGLSDGFNYR